MNNDFELPLDDFPLDHPRAQEVIDFFGGKEIIKVPREMGLQAGRCYWNVNDLIKKQGGKLVYGWMLEWHPNLVVFAMHHGVYQSPDGKLIDVSSTDTARTTNNTSFLPSNEIEIDLKKYPRIPRRSFPLIDDNDLTRYLYLYTKNFQAHSDLAYSCLERGTAVFNDGALAYIDIPDDISRRLKPEIESTSKERYKLKITLFSRYFHRVRN
ncbi:hypothetical protein LO750_12560 [Klebsiella aerogenes]|uniref:hypothetical protein n=1 Tax=Klebsiella aerogenes TaxID=548 RepID=UPI001E5C1C30|nr:hypothetical protein [Klebsiella aerogenes]MCD0204822.1 hypothetical protein [Klebsiella aerogenes]